MTKGELIKVLTSIESAYSTFVLRDETVLQWFQICSKMDYEKVMAKVENHIRKSRFPPGIADIAVFSFEENDFPETIQNWIKEGCERIEYHRHAANRHALPDWLREYSARPSF